MLTITPETRLKLTVGAFFAVVISAGGVAWKAQATLSAINTNIQDTSARVTAVEAALSSKFAAFEITMSDRFTKTAAAEWALRLVVNNPALRIPDPRDPSRLLSVREAKDGSTVQTSIMESRW